MLLQSVLPGCATGEAGGHEPPPCLLLPSPKLPTPVRQPPGYVLQATKGVHEEEGAATAPAGLKEMSVTSGAQGRDGRGQQGHGHRRITARASSQAVWKAVEAAEGRGGPQTPVPGLCFPSAVTALSSPFPGQPLPLAVPAPHHLPPTPCPPCRRARPARGTSPNPGPCSPAGDAGAGLLPPPRPPPQAPLGLRPSCRQGCGETRSRGTALRYGSSRGAAKHQNYPDSSKQERVLCCRNAGGGRRLREGARAARPQPASDSYTEKFLVSSSESTERAWCRLSGITVH